jgi:hypothetical protein
LSSVDAIFIIAACAASITFCTASLPAASSSVSVVVGGSDGHDVDLGERQAVYLFADGDER